MTVDRITLEAMRRASVAELNPADSITALYYVMLGRYANGLSECSPEEVREALAIAVGKERH